MYKTVSKHAVQKRLLAILLSTVLAFTVFAAMPMNVHAATGMVTIDVSTLVGSNNNNSAASATESQWNYRSDNKVLYLTTDAGSYKLIGSNSDLEVIVMNNVGNVKLTLSNVDIKSQSNRALGFGCTSAAVTLEGVNKIVSTTEAALSIDSYKSCEFGGMGSLQLSGSAAGPEQITVDMYPYSSMIVTGGATVTMSGTNNAGILGERSNTIKVGSGSVLNVSGKWGFSSPDMSIYCDGAATFIGSDGSGLGISYGSCVLSGSGTVKAGSTSGSAIWYGSGVSSIKMGDKVRLELSPHGTNQLITLEKADPASTFIWKLTSATASDPLAAAKIGVTVANGATGIVQRVAAAAPSITGPVSMSLDMGYAATSTGIYTAVGFPDPKITKTSGDAKITWNSTSSALDIAPGLAPGTYPVTLTADNGVTPAAVAVFTLTVKDLPAIGGGEDGDANVTQVLAPLKTVYIVKGKSLTVPCMAYEKGVRSSVPKLWKSSNAKIVKVTQSGKVTGLKTGKATVTVNAAGKKLKLTVYVVSKAVKLTGAAVTVPGTIRANTTKDIVVKPVPAKATGVKVTFKSSNPGGLIADKAGKLTGVKPGTYTVTIIVGSKTIKKTVKVV